MKWFEKSLTQDCLGAARKLAPLPWLKDFYLAGGTALALWYGHRVSVDLDFFSPSNPLGAMERQTLITQCAALGMQIEEEKDGTVHALWGKTHVSFFRYLYPLVKPTTPWLDMPIADPVDIGLMKLGAVIGRGSKKDFIDIAALSTRGVTIKQLLRAAPEKFPNHRDFTLQALRALVYFADAEGEPLPRMNDRLSWAQVKKIIETEVRALAGESLGAEP